MFIFMFASMTLFNVAMEGIRTHDQFEMIFGSVFLLVSLYFFINLALSIIKDTISVMFQFLFQLKNISKKVRKMG